MDRVTKTKILKGRKTYRTDDKNFVTTNRSATLSLRNLSMPTRRETFIDVQRKSSSVLKVKITYSDNPTKDNPTMGNLMKFDNPQSISTQKYTDSKTNLY